MSVTQYVPMETFYKKADATDAANNTVVFVLPYMPTGAIAQIRANADGAVNATGLAVTFATNSDTGVITATVAASNITANDHVSLIVF